MPNNLGETADIPRQPSTTPPNLIAGKQEQADHPMVVVCQRGRWLRRRLRRRVSQWTTGTGGSGGTGGGSEVRRAAERYFVRSSLSDPRSKALCSSNSTAASRLPSATSAEPRCCRQR